MLLTTSGAPRAVSAPFSASSARRASARRSALLGGDRRVMFRAATRAVVRRGGEMGKTRGGARTVAEVKKAWTSSKSMTLTIKDEDKAHPFSAYISDGERIVNVTFPDEKRREKLSDTTWKVQLLPFEFFQWRATVFCTLRLEPGKDGLRLSAEDLSIDGLPDELGVNGKVWLSMDGQLKPAKTATKAGRKVLGKLTVNLSAEVNDMVARIPGIDDAVNLINDTVIANLQGSINATIAGDYQKWKVKQQQESLTVA